MLGQRDGLQLGIDFKGNRLVVPIQIMPIGADAFIGMLSSVMVSPRGLELLVLHGITPPQSTDGVSSFLLRDGSSAYFQCSMHITVFLLTKIAGTDDEK